MAGKGRKIWTRETLSSADVQDYLMDQAVMTFPSAAARDVAIPAPTEGMHCFLDDADLTQVFRAGAWGPLGVATRVAQTGQVNSIAANRPLIVQAFTAVVTTNAGGNSSVAFPQAFPNGVLTIQLTSGDAAAGNHAKAAVAAVPTLAGFTGSHWQPNGAVCASATIRVNCVAVGW